MFEARVEELVRGLRAAAASLDVSEGASSPTAAPSLQDAALVDTMVAAARLSAWADAIALQAIGELRSRRASEHADLVRGLGGTTAVAAAGGPAHGDEVDRFTAVEVAAALQLSSRAARARVELAETLGRRAPVVLSAMRAGVLMLGHARAALEAVEPLGGDVAGGPESDEAARQVVADVVLSRAEAAAERGEAGRLGTPGQLGAALRRRVAREGPDAAARCEVARRRRLVSSWGLPDGMAVLQVLGPAPTIAAAMAHVDERARALQDASRLGAGRSTDVLTLDQARADAALEALAGSPDLERVPSARSQVTIDLLVPLGVLTGEPGWEPAELPGYGPLPDVVVTALVRSSRDHRRVRVTPLDDDGRIATDCPTSPHQHPRPDGLVVRASRGGDSVAGTPAAGSSVVDASVPPSAEWTYRPGARLERLVRARDITCRFPGCRARAARCDADHSLSFPEGPTTACNLACLCRHHHRAKHRARWRQRQLPTGQVTFTAPTRHVYVTDTHRWHRRVRGRAAGSGDGGSDGPDRRPGDAAL